MPLMKLNNDEEFCWREAQQKSFDNIKEYLIQPPALIPLEAKDTIQIIFISRRRLNWIHTNARI